MICSLCADPLSSYPTAKLLCQLKVDQWLKLRHHLNLTDKKLESELKKSPHPTAATLLAAKVKNIDLKWNDVVKSLLHIGEYKLAETVCSRQGLSLASSLLSVQSVVCTILMVTLVVQQRVIKVDCDLVVLLL